MLSHMAVSFANKSFGGRVVVVSFGKGVFLLSLLLFSSFDLITCYVARRWNARRLSPYPMLRPALFPWSFM